MTNMPKAIVDLKLSKSPLTTRRVHLCQYCLDDEFGGDVFAAANNVQNLLYHTYDPVTRRDIVHLNDPSNAGDDLIAPYTDTDDIRCAICAEHTKYQQDIDVDNGQAVRQQMRYIKTEAFLCAHQLDQGTDSDGVSYCAECNSEDVKWLTDANFDHLVGRYVYSDNEPERMECNACGGVDESSIDRPLNPHEQVDLIAKRTARHLEKSKEHESILQWLQNTSFVSEEVIAQIKQDAIDIEARTLEGFDIF